MDFIRLKKILIMVLAMMVGIAEGMRFPYMPVDIPMEFNRSMQQVTILPYDPLWNLYFAMEYDNLKKAFNKSHLRAIEHFGSTSVEGMWAKPSIAIIVGLSDFNLTIEELFELQELGYEFIENSAYCQRYYLSKRADFIGFKLSITTYQGNTWNRCIAFRDYLRNHPEVRKKYIKIKKEAIVTGHTLLCDYSMYKRNFIMELEQVMAVVVLESYSSAWLITFKQEAEMIKQALVHKNIKRIEHFGSTSVEGMLAKPIVDIIVGLDELSLTEDDIQLLRDQGYEFIEKSSYCERYYFIKRKNGRQIVNLSIVKIGSDTWEKCLNVRDYLRTHSEEKEKYMKIKLEALRLGNNLLIDYSNYKSKHIGGLVERSHAWRCAAH